MTLVPFSKKYPGEFLNRTEDNFSVLLEKIKRFHKETRADIQEGDVSRRKLEERFNYQEELKDVQFNQKGIDTEEVAIEFNDMLRGCIRSHDPTSAFNINPSPLFDCVAGLAITCLYNPNLGWDFVSGKLCLYEKKIVRMLGKLVGWPHADGFVITGGKQAIAYAIKNGIGRASGCKPAKMDEYVVISSVVSHYSIEHVCQYLGISPENCVRVGALQTGEIDLRELKTSLKSAISQGKKIAAVIAVAGATINLVPDPILQIKETIDQVAKDYSLDYTPYLHVDSVITWAWLAFNDHLACLSDTHPNVQSKVQAVLSKLVGIAHADSFAADFHKTGFCPYAAGVFIAKDSDHLLGMNMRGYFASENPFFGELEPLRQTFENSRSALPIVSIWIAMRRMGLEGLRQYVLYQLQVCELFKQKVREKYDDHFEILNDHSKGWEIVLKPHFCQKLSWDQLQEASDKEQQDYIRVCYDFISDCWYSPIGSNQTHPVIGFVPKYSRKGVHEKSLPALLVHPTSLHYDDEAVEEMVDKIFNVKAVFDSRCDANLSPAEGYLHAMVPPR